MYSNGKIINNYKILECIGEGGMGVVYRARHVHLNHQVALKMLKESMVEHPGIVRRFFQEARSVKEIHSPYIVGIAELVDGLDQKPPVAYMVLELLSGQDLASRISEVGPMDPTKVVSVGIQIIIAMVAVHQARLLHRDLKPANIYLAEHEDGFSMVKLLDFGSVKALNQKPQLYDTDPGTAVGTPSYMAPEQFIDRGIDARTDIYSLGVVLYHMLAGDLPFRATSFGELMIQIVKEPPPPIASLRLAETPAPLETVVMRCLEKDPGRRFQSMVEVREALESVFEPDLQAKRQPSSTSGTIDCIDLGEPEKEEAMLTQVMKPARAMLGRPLFWITVVSVMIFAILVFLILLRF